MTTNYGSKELAEDYGELTFGEALHSYRLCEEITQKAFAKNLGISQSSLCDIEQGRRIPSIGRAAKIANLIGMPEETWVKLSLQDSLKKEKLNYIVILKPGEMEYVANH